MSALPETKRLSELVNDDEISTIEPAVTNPRDGTFGIIGTLALLNGLNGAKRLNGLNYLNAFTNGRY
jgi:hypothetical protein